MKLLTDAELVPLLTAPKPFILGIPTPHDWLSRTSSVQPSSVDLHIGDIFLPEAKARKRGSTDKPSHDYCLKSGETAVVTTFEDLAFPSNLCAIAFPPSHVSFKGILMTNPGHIDPGYHGKMRFTVINMGRESYSLKTLQPIITLCVFDLEGHPKRDYRQRREGQGALIDVQETLERLSADFIDVRRRARKEARSIVLKAGLMVALLVAGGTLAVSYLNTRFSKSDDIEALRKDINRIQDELWKSGSRSAQSPTTAVPQPKPPGATRPLPASSP